MKAKNRLGMKKRVIIRAMKAKNRLDNKESVRHHIITALKELYFYLK
jgi:hypothetical protein